MMTRGPAQAGIQSAAERRAVINSPRSTTLQRQAGAVVAAGRRSAAGRRTAHAPRQAGRRCNVAPGAAPHHPRPTQPTSAVRICACSGRWITLMHWRATQERCMALTRPGLRGGAWGWGPASRELVAARRAPAPGCAVRTRIAQTANPPSLVGAAAGCRLHRWGVSRLTLGGGTREQARRRRSWQRAAAGKAPRGARRRHGQSCGGWRGPAAGEDAAAVRMGGEAGAGRGGAQARRLTSCPSRPEAPPQTRGWRRLQAAGGQRVGSQPASAQQQQQRGRRWRGCSRYSRGREHRKPTAESSGCHRGPAATAAPSTRTGDQATSARVACREGRARQQAGAAVSAWGGSTEAGSGSWRGEAGRHRPSRGLLASSGTRHRSRSERHQAPLRGAPAGAASGRLEANAGQAASWASVAQHTRASVARHLSAP